ncbi:MAG: neutral zinc metallopeptidase [Alphaproteobacteria bacterium]|nr:neutral zinc metallopeptidase [Alphaproteobacteria bacterium]
MKPGKNRDEDYQFYASVLASTEDVWDDIFADLGLRYRPPKLVLFDGIVHTKCGFLKSAAYCPSERKLYLDPVWLDCYVGKAFWGKDFPPAAFDFAKAVAVAHEAAHHVQTFLEHNRKTSRAYSLLSEKEKNRISVEHENHADFLVGVWARAMDEDGLLDETDIQAALRLFHYIGADSLDNSRRGYRMNPPADEASYIHGTSKQRRSSFLRGYLEGYHHGQPLPPAPV